MSLFLLKTKDLTWQDRALNMEVMLEPKRTSLLLKKNRSLSMNNEKDNVRYSKQANTQLRMYKAEKHYIDKKNQELYLVKTKRFLGSLTPEQRAELLSRKSFSIGLSKLTKDIEEEEEYNEKNPVPLNNRKPSLFGSFVSYIDSPRVAEEDTTQRNEEPEIILPELSDKSSRAARMDRRFASPKHDYRRFRSTDHIDVIDIEDISNPQTPIPSYLPSVSPCQKYNRPKRVISPVVKPNNYSIPNLQNGEESDINNSTMDSKKTVQFETKTEQPETPRINYESEKKKVEKSKPYIQKKINTFLLQQSTFNKKAPVVLNKNEKPGMSEDTYSIDKGKLVNAFDDFCLKGDKERLHRLVKYATKYKVTSTFKQNVVTPSVHSFKTSRTFMNLGRSPLEQQVKA